MLAYGLVIAFEQRQQAVAVLAGGVGQRGAEDVGERGHDVGLRDELAAGTAGFHGTGPAHDEGHAMPAFPRVSLVTAQRAAGMVALLFEIADADVGRAAVVAGEDDERVVGGTALIECGEHAADDGIGLHDEVGVEIEPALVLPLGIHRQWRVRRGEGHVQQEGLRRLRLALDEGHGLVAERGKDALEHPILQSGAALAGLIGFEVLLRQKLGRDAERAIVLDEAVGRPVRHVGAEVAVEAARGRPARDRFRKHGAPGREMRWRGDGAFVVRTLRFRALQELALRRLDGPVPAEMPFADDAGVVAVLLREAADGQPVRRDERIAKHADDAALQTRAPVVAPGEHRVARGRAHARGRMRIREAHALRGEPVHVRRRDLPALRIVALHVAIAEVVEVENEHVRLLREGAVGEQQEGGETESGEADHGREIKQSETGLFVRQVVMMSEMRIFRQQRQRNADQHVTRDRRCLLRHHADLDPHRPLPLVKDPRLPPLGLDHHRRQHDYHRAAAGDALRI